MKPSKNFPFHKSRPLSPEKLPAIYRQLHRHFGHQRWWPGETPFEVMVGAILTQNTAWTNVKKAVANLKKANALTPLALQRISKPRLASLIRPSGYFNVKAERLKDFVEFLFVEYQGNLRRMFRDEGKILRQKLLRVRGIGPETADSILLYAAQKPFFVIDAYTRRIFLRHRLQVISDLKRLNPHLHRMTYHDWQNVFTEHLPQNPELYNDFHAQLVVLAKQHCKKTRPLCDGCPLRNHL